MAQLYVCSLPNPGTIGIPHECFYSDDDAGREKARLFIERENKPGRGVYYCIGKLKDGARSRSKENVVELESVVVDLDLKNIVEPRDKVIEVLRALLLPPSEIRDSGFGLHPEWRFKEAVNDEAGMRQAEDIMAGLVKLLAGDPAPTHRAALLRQPGTDNTKGDKPRRCRVLERSGQQCDISEFDTLFDYYGGRPLLTAKQKPATNGHDTKAAHHGGQFKPLIDVDARLAAMKFGGPGDSSIHMTQLSVTASLLRSGVALEETTRIVVEATRAAVANDPAWNWRREELKILRMSCDFVFKNPELASLLPDDWQAPFAAALAAGRRPDVGLNRVFYFRAWKNNKAGADAKKAADNADASSSGPAGWHLYDRPSRRNG